MHWKALAEILFPFFEFTDDERDMWEKERKSKGMGQRSGLKGKTAGFWQVVGSLA